MYCYIWNKFCLNQIKKKKSEEIIQIFRPYVIVKHEIGFSR